MQKAVADLLSPIYEQDFLDCSYGFGPGRGAREALDKVWRVLCREPTSCVLELDIKFVLRFDCAATSVDRPFLRPARYPWALHIAGCVWQSGQ